ILDKHLPEVRNMLQEKDFMTLTEEDISLKGKEKRSSEGGRENRCNK
ncbi:8934_t:CDS:2, partial [Funneliformis caledonium]